jgi:outer membrane protein assembly factor BamE (lipoprotein component of BamABCDE complex)
MHILSSRKTLLAASLVLGMVAGCAETLDTHGQVLLPSALAQIKPNITTKDDVVRLLGTPSAKGTMNDNRWYYVNSVVGKKAFSPHNLKNRKVLMLDFDPSSSVVIGMSERTEADGKMLEPSRAETKTQGQTMGFIEQVMGNVGLKQ